MADQSNIQSAASKSIRPFKSSEEYLYAMKEDLAEWLNTLYDLEITADTFMEGLETGGALCRHANNVNRAALDFQLENPEAASSMRVPHKDVVFQPRSVAPGSFVARDNVSNFIAWCRQELWIQDVLMFETDDLVLRKNEKNFVLCLLEVARRGAKFGMLAPMLIQLEEEIEEEIRDQESLAGGTWRSPPSREENPGEPRPGVPMYPSWPQRRVLCDMRNLDELVREILGRCSCPSQFPMTKVSEGKYKVGDSSALIFIRYSKVMGHWGPHKTHGSELVRQVCNSCGVFQVLRTHVMVRVGGGWDTLEHYLDKHDPCRCNAFAHRYQQSRSSSLTPCKTGIGHISQSPSTGPHWKTDSGTPLRTPDRRTLEPPGTGRTPRHSLPTELDASTSRTPATPRPPRDRSEPRHAPPLRSKEALPVVTRKLSGDSDSSTASSKGVGGRPSLPGGKKPGEEVVLLVSRREGKHVIERPGATHVPALRPPQPRARSQSRDRSVILRPNPPLDIPKPDSIKARPDRGRSLGPESPRKLQTSRSQSQGKPFSRGRDSEANLAQPRGRVFQPPRAGGDPRAKSSTPSSPKIGVGAFPRKQNISSLGKGSQSSPSKKVPAPRTTGPKSPAVGRSRLLPPVPRSHRSNPRSSYGNLSRGGSSEWLDTEDGDLAVTFQALPCLDPSREKELYRSFEAEFLANTQMSSFAEGGDDYGDLLAQPLQQQALQQPPLGDPNVTDSAYSSSNSSTSSLNVGNKLGVLPDLRDSTRATVPQAGGCGQSHMDVDRWAAHSELQGPKMLPVLSSSLEEREFLSSVNNLKDKKTAPPSAAVWRLDPGDVISGHKVVSQSNRSLDLGSGTKGVMNSRKGNSRVRLDSDDLDGDLESLQNQEGASDFEDDDDITLLPPDAHHLAPSEFCSFLDSSSEGSCSQCVIQNEPCSVGSPTPPLQTADPCVVLRPKKGLKKPERVPSIYKLKLRPKLRPRTDNRPEKSPSRIPTPVSYKQGVQVPQPPPSPRVNGHPGWVADHRSRRALHQALTDLINPSEDQRDGSSVESGSLDDEAWM